MEAAEVVRAEGDALEVGRSLLLCLGLLVDLDVLLHRLLAGLRDGYNLISGLEI